MNDDKVIVAFHKWLDEFWPLWKRHQYGVKYNDLRAAFIAGSVLTERDGS